MATNKYHALVCALCRREGWPEPLAEVTPLVGRRFRCDLLWMSVAPALAVEVNGGAFIGGRHSRGIGQVKDWEKLNLLQLAGIRVLQVTPKQVTDGTLQRLLAEAFREAA